MSVHSEIKKVTTETLRKMKFDKEKITMLTAYDYTTAKMVDALNKASGLQAPTGIPQTPEMMAPPTEHSANDGHGH